MDGGRGRTRTGTPVSRKQILSLLCLPFHHAAHGCSPPLLSIVCRAYVAFTRTERFLPPPVRPGHRRAGTSGHRGPA
jgi:hypothetical protein